jgi:diaminohydroxyphosphoribosylaminopyrimidine deaminase/5-amino-6-(5-phosphoribosylamino)uracil reductase
MAATMDGKIAAAPGRRDRITGPAAQRFVHRMRAASDCVVVGADTVIIDRPRLDCRFLSEAPAVGRAPVPVVLDTNLRVPAGNLWTEERREYVVLCGPDPDRNRADRLEAGGAVVKTCPRGSGGVAIDGALRVLAELGFERIMVEGGSAVFTSFLDSNQWHALYLFQSQAMFGENGVPMYRGDGSPVRGALVEQTRVGDDTLHLYIDPRTLEEIMERVHEEKGI